MKHEKEIIRWAKCPEGTEVWYKKKCGKWNLIDGPSWSAMVSYIVNDEYAEIRKAERDGETILYNGKESSGGLTFTGDIEDYSIRGNFTPVLKRSSLTNSIFCFISEESAYLISVGRKDNFNVVGDLVEDLKSVHSDNWEDV